MVAFPYPDICIVIELKQYKMNDLMKAVVLTEGVLTVQRINKPTVAVPGHLVIKMNSSAINSGDKFFEIPTTSRYG